MIRRLLVATFAVTAFAQNDDTARFDAKLAEVARAYTARIEQAKDELNAARERIAREKAPQLNAMRAVEERILRLRAEIARERIVAGNFAANRERREQEAEAQRLNISFLAGSAAEGLSALSTTRGHIEIGDLGLEVDALRKRLDPAGADPDVAAAADTAALVLARVKTLLGGHTESGMAVSPEIHQLAQGRFIFLGPEIFFVADADAVAGTVRAREEGATPMVHALPNWDHRLATALANGQTALTPTDVTGGKALQLRENQGDWIDHINKGGIVGYAIIGLGLFALLTAAVKLIDLRKLSVDKPVATANLLEHVAARGAADTSALIEPLRRTSRGLFATGLRHLAKPKEVVEEHLHAFILRERLHHERWLPMLAVIAAASPLLGLLGTVVGMVKTFTLITVFGTGNASKLSSGISEALVTTELGLTVAIPTLVLHGFLSYRTQKNLSLLERYAVEFVTATEDHKVSESSA